MMKVLAVLLMVALSVMAMPGKAPDVDIPGGLDRSETPQFVMLTFDDYVNPLNILYYRQALYGRRNPNNCPVAATFFVLHEYSDYSLVHELHANGQQISLRALTNQIQWNDSMLVQEFTDLRTLTSYFAKIPEEDIKGIRMSSLQMTGNDQFEILKQGGFLYDMSWRFPAGPSMWPYTSDYPESFSNTWIIPMTDWRDQNQTMCPMVDACVDVPKDVEGLTQWMIGEFNKQYNGNRAPFGFFVHSGWFAESFNPNHLIAFIAFLDHLQTLPDVYLVSGSQVIDWVKDPVPISQLQPGDTECQKTYTPTCQPLLCQLKKGDYERWMTCCADTCPKSFPWVGNPLGTL